MTENLGVLDVLELHSANLASTWAALDDANDVLEAAKGTYQLARDAKASAGTRNQTAIANAISKIHDVYTPGTSPVDCVIAIASALNNGNRGGIMAAFGTELEQMQQQMLTTPTLLAVVNPPKAKASIAFGRSRGGMQVRKSDPKERSATGPGGLILELPLDCLHQMGRIDEDQPWWEQQIVLPPEYEGNGDPDPFMMGVRQVLPNLSIAGTTEQVQAAIADAENARVEVQDEDTFGERELDGRLITAAGMLPIIAYGYTAVSAVLRNLGRRVVEGQVPKVNPADVAATAINIGINPRDIADSESRVRTELGASFADGIGALIARQVRVDLSGKLSSSESLRLNHRPPTATVEVMEYLQARGSVATIARDRFGLLLDNATTASPEGISSTSARVAHALGELFQVEIDPEYLAVRN